MFVDRRANSACFWRQQIVVVKVRQMRGMHRLRTALLSFSCACERDLAWLPAVYKYSFIFEF